MITDARLDELIVRDDAMSLDQTFGGFVSDHARALRELRTCRKLVKEYLDAVDALMSYRNSPNRAHQMYRPLALEKAAGEAEAALRAFIAGEG